MKTIIFIVTVFILLCLSCSEHLEVSKPPVNIEYNSIGHLDASLNGQLWTFLKPKDVFSTRVQFSDLLNRTFNCGNTNLTSFLISTYGNFNQGDYFLAINIEKKTVGLYSDFANYNVLPKTDKCVTRSITLQRFESDAKLADYYLDTSKINYFRINRIIADSMEGDFNLSFIEKRKLLGVPNPHSDVLDTIHFNASKFIAIRDTSK